MQRNVVRSFGFIFSLVALLVLPASGHAQAGVYGMLSAGHYSGLGVGYGTAPTQSGGMTARGGTVGVYDNFMPFGPVRFGGDARAIIQNSANSTTYGNKVAGFLFGPRLEIAPPPPVPIKPYIQLEFGGIATNNGSSTNKTTSFAYQVNGGVDFTILPHLDVRAEYGAGQLTSIGNNHHTLQELGIGLVLRM